MHFLKTLFWVLLAVFIALFASRNWSDVTLNLWSGLQADIKAPVLLALVFLLGWLPTFLIYRARLWAMRRRADGTHTAPPAIQANEPAPMPQSGESLPLQ
jgi:putative membrane protein